MKEYVRTILDYPVKGIQFRDITTLLQNAGHFKQVIDEMTTPWINKKIDAVLSIESRGFIMAGAIAYKLNSAFIPFRKPDKLPGETYKVFFPSPVITIGCSASILSEDLMPISFSRSSLVTAIGPADEKTPVASLIFCLISSGNLS